MSDNGSFEIPFDLGASCLYDENDVTNLDDHQQGDRDTPTPTSPITIHDSDSDDSATDDGNPSSSGPPVIRFRGNRLETCKQTECNDRIEADDADCTCKAHPQSPLQAVDDEDQVMESAGQNEEPQAASKTNITMADRIFRETHASTAREEAMYQTNRMMKLREKRL